MADDVTNSKFPERKTVDGLHSEQLAIFAATSSQSPLGHRKPEIPLTEAVGELNHYVQDVQRSLQCAITDDVEHTMITIIDRDSGMVIRQFPIDQVLKMAQILKDYTVNNEDKGLLFSGLILESRA